MKAVIAFVLFFSAVALGAKGDRPGSSDHPLLTRLPGSVIMSYQQAEYDEYLLALGKALRGKNNEFERSEKVAGKDTAIKYRSDGAHSVLEIFENYRQALASAGFEISFSCAQRSECGDRLAGYMGASQYNDYRYLAAKGGDAAAPVYVALLAYKPGAGAEIVSLHITESKSMKSGMVTATAAAITQALAAQGKFALYGLYFDTGKAELKPESDPALAEVAQVLKSDASLQLYLVGHTDSVGQVTSNVELSERRAAAAVKALVERYGIAARRLTPKGVGPFAPVGSNRTEEGRAKNRRVELVEP